MVESRYLDLLNERSSCPTSKNYTQPDWSEEQLETIYNHDLCNVYGNLLARTVSAKFRRALAVAREHVRTMPHDLTRRVSYISLLEDQDGTYETEDHHIRHILRTLNSDVHQLMEEFEFSRALERIQECLIKVRTSLTQFGRRADSTHVTTNTQANEYTTQLAWWHNTQNRIAVLRRTHLYTHESLRIASILLQPFMPSKTADALDILGVYGNHRNWSDAALGGELRIEQESERYNSERGVLFSPLESRRESSSNMEFVDSKQANQTEGERKMYRDMASQCSQHR